MPDDERRTDIPETAHEARVHAERALQDQQALWARVTKSTSYLRRRATVNHFSEGIDQVFASRR